MTALKLSISSALLAAASALSLTLPLGCGGAQDAAPEPTAEPMAAPTTAEAPSPETVRTKGPVAMASDALGINEAVSFPLRLELREGPPSVSRLAADAQAADRNGKTALMCAWRNLTTGRLCSSNALRTMPNMHLILMPILLNKVVNFVTHYSAIICNRSDEKVCTSKY